MTVTKRALSLSYSLITVNIMSRLSNRYLENLRRLLSTNGGEALRDNPNSHKKTIMKVEQLAISKNVTKLSLLFNNKFKKSR